MRKFLAILLSALFLASSIVSVPAQAEEAVDEVIVKQLVAMAHTDVWKPTDGHWRTPTAMAGPTRRGTRVFRPPSSIRRRNL